MEPIFELIGGESKFFNYYLIDDNGYCSRSNIFKMPVGTVFEHDFGTYIVTSIEHDKIFCDRL